MIHEFIFAYPRPGMTEAEFQRYWVDVHAVRYASKIPQARRYLVNTRIALPGENSDPLWCGVGEFWFENEKERIDSLQSKEFLQGARLDEPNWAASWRGLTLDTTDHTIRRGPEETRDNGMAKLLVQAQGGSAARPLPLLLSRYPRGQGARTAGVASLPPGPCPG
jgi:hypothetical protein